jgi:predicted AAA+ superfamily ATPase
MKLIDRKISDEINALKTFYPVITITGPRQSGKTTLCKMMFPEYAYYNLEDAEIMERIKADPKGFIRENPGGIIIDEAHHYPELFPLIQVTVDQEPGRKFVLTGSSNFALLQSITQSLAGRTVLLTLLPLSLHELGDVVKETNTDTLIINGGYPHIWAIPDYPRYAFYKNYYATYVERDVRQIINIKDMFLFQKFIRLCAGRIGTECNASSLSNEVGVSSLTIQSWFSILAASYVAWQLPPYFANIGKRLIKTAKLYFYDVGLACYLLGIENETQLSTHPLRGSLFENMVINEAMKNRLNRGKDPDLYFYKDKSQREVDLLHAKGDQLSAYEIKSSQTWNNEFYKGINYIKGLFGEKITRSALLYDGTMAVNSQENGAMNFRDFYLE